MTVSDRYRLLAPPPIGGSSPTVAVTAGVAASAVLGLGMLLLRSTAGVRTIPERMMEWVLLFVPTGVFEALLQLFGFDAKRYALDAAVLVMLGFFAWLGHYVMRHNWSVRAIASLGPAVWLVIMLVVMPLTSAGVFATDLHEGTPMAVLGYLAVSLSFAAALVMARVWVRVNADTENESREGVRRRNDRRPVHRHRGGPDKRRFGAVRYQRGLPDADRRLALGVIGGAGVAYVATFASGLLLPASTRAPSILLVDPQEPVPSGGIDPPNSHPQAVASPVAQPPVATSTPVASATPGLPEPVAARELQRDKDGAVLPSGRRPGQLASAITSNQDFYVVTKNAGGDPTLHPNDWRLLVDGDVERTFQLDYATLRRMPAVQVTRTLECISNLVGKPELAPFGAELISTARWKGVPVRDILALIGGPRPTAQWLAVLSADEYTCALPLDAAMDPATLLVYEMNGEVLPHEHGYPARLLVPGRYGMKNPKWVVGLRPMAREFLDWYGLRNWSKDGIVRTMTRIDMPAPGARLKTGQNTVSGVAYAGSRGIKSVEYSWDDGGTWQEADVLEPAAGQDAWVRWRGLFEVPPDGKVTLVARATDGAGALQEEDFTLPEPNGGTGWPSIDIG